MPAIGQRCFWSCPFLAGEFLVGQRHFEQIGNQFGVIVERLVKIAQTVE
jgi:hypothetical protein